MVKREPLVLVCHRCDFGSGRRGMDRCPTCDGTGSVFRVGWNFYPNTEAGFDEARAALQEHGGDHG